MKTNAKLALAAIAAAVLTTTGAFANDLVLVQIPNGHGDHVSFYRPVQQPRTTTVAVYAHRRGAGSVQTTGDRQASQLRFEAIPNPHGGQVTFYRSAE